MSPEQQAEAALDYADESAIRARRSFRSRR